MEELVNKIKKKLSVESLIEIMKETKVIDEKHLKEEDVRKSLEKIDLPRNLIDFSELTAKLHEVGQEVAAKTATAVTIASSKAVSEKIISAVFNVLKKGESIEKHENDEDEAFKIKDNISGFFD